MEELIISTDTRGHDHLCNITWQRILVKNNKLIIQDYDME